MNLYLVQHGLSLPEDVDPEKPLSPLGKEQTQGVMDFLKGKKIKVDELWYSPKKRAVQTAQIISENILCSHIQERKDLNPLDPVKDFPQEIESLSKDLMIVGHLPFLQKLASLLLSGREDHQFISFRNSGVICLEHTDGWKFLWAAIPELLLEGQNQPSWP
ncbi:MAG: phosphohistidine phosphatase SixA [Candidatus Aminicenantes bacterium]|nr:phosphohistidine phosphatase SixA [Candidatus Aminicenantes bacterium]